MESNFDISTQCYFLPWSDELKKEVSPIHCGDHDLDDFFANDAVLYEKELLGRTYVWVTKNDKPKIVAAVTLANDSIKSKLITRTSLNRINRHISNHKRGRSYPAVLIGRLGVDKDYQGGGKHIGSQVVNFLKIWFFSSNNKTGCRFLVVDAYNSQNVLRFYENCGFKFLYGDEQEEKDFFELNTDERLHTRMMYLDLK